MSARQTKVMKFLWKNIKSKKVTQMMNSKLEVTLLAHLQCICFGIWAIVTWRNKMWLPAKPLYIDRNHGEFDAPWCTSPVGERNKCLPYTPSLYRVFCVVLKLTSWYSQKAPGVRSDLRQCRGQARDACKAGGGEGCHAENTARQHAQRGPYLTARS